MNNDSDGAVGRVVALAGDGTGQTAAELATFGWDVRRLDDDSAPQDLDGLLFDPGLLEAAADVEAGDVAAALRTAVDQARKRFRSSGGRVVVIASRDHLGAPGHGAHAAVGGALVSAVRSLALELGRSAITVNLVVGLPARPGTADTGVAARVEALLPRQVTAVDVAATAGFLLDPRSSYITGQVLHCTGGASLLSSLTA